MKWCAPWLSAIAALAGLTASLAQNVTAELSAEEVAVGEALELVVTAAGRGSAQLLDDPVVDGLEVTGRSQQTQIQMSIPGGIQATNRIVFTLVPQREGEFRIPPLRVRVDGQVLQTPEKVLRVRAGTAPLPPLQSPPASRLPSPVSPSAPAPPADKAFGEIVLSKDKAYVGELVPAELRFFVNERLPAQFAQRPSFSGEGITVQRFGPPTQARRDVGGEIFQSLSFPTAVTPAKTGILDIPPASLPARVRVPAQLPGNVQDLLGGWFSFGLAEERDIEIRTGPARMNVLPLPSEGRPPDFSGAIGQFEIRTEVSPKKAEPGEPVTLKVMVSGRGNFEAMGPPELVHAEGWRVYDPVDSFQPSPGDPIGFLGEKTFEFTLVAERDQRATPPVRFSFFDPEAGAYRTLEAPPVAVAAKGARGPAPSLPAPAPAVPAAQEQSAAQGPAAELSRDYTPGSFRPAAWEPGFLWAWALLAAVWLGALAVILRRGQSDSPAARRRAQRQALRRELRELASPLLDDAAFLDRAVMFLERRLAGRTVTEAAPEEIRPALEELIARHAEARYSPRPAAPLEAGGRRGFLEALQALDRALPLATALLLAAWGAGVAAPVEDAITSYEKGDFQEAARLFESAAASQPPSAGMEYNLGMALKRSGQPGPAALHLLRAIALNPRLADAHVALSDLERSQGIPFRKPSVFAWLAEHSSLTAWLVTGFVVFWAGAFGVLAAVGRRARAGAFLLAATALAAGAVVFAAAYLADPRFAWREEIVALREVILTSEPASRSEAIARLPGGSRAQFLRRSGDWCALRLHDGRMGWAAADAIEWIIPKNDPAPEATPAAPTTAG